MQVLVVKIRSTCATLPGTVKCMNAPYEPLLHALSHAHDIDPEETAEWREALLALIGTQGPERARQILTSWPSWRASSAPAGSPS